MKCIICHRPLKKAAAMDAKGPIGSVCAQSLGLLPPKAQHGQKKASNGRTATAERIEENQLELEI